MAKRKVAELEVGMQKDAHPGIDEVMMRLAAMPDTRAMDNDAFLVAMKRFKAEMPHL
jgi:hypothetical protein